jgi:hypothetical protein
LARSRVEAIPLWYVLLFRSEGAGAFLVLLCHKVAYVIVALVAGASDVTRKGMLSVRV